MYCSFPLSPPLSLSLCPCLLFWPCLHSCTVFMPRSLSLSPISFVAPVPVVFSRCALPLCCPLSLYHDLFWVLSLCVSCFLICYLCAWSVFIFIFPGFETQATWLRADRGTAPALERPWQEKISAHSRKRERETPPSGFSGHVLKGGAQPSFQPSDWTQGTTKNRRTQTGQSKEEKRASHTTHSQILFRNFSLPFHTPSFSFIVHCSFMCDGPRVGQQLPNYDHAVLCLPR